jgi:hypothetical protein
MKRTLTLVCMTSHELYVFLGRPRMDVLAPKRSRH